MSQEDDALPEWARITSDLADDADEITADTPVPSPAPDPEPAPVPVPVPEPVPVPVPTVGPVKPSRPAPERATEPVPVLEPAAEPVPVPLPTPEPVTQRDPAVPRRPIPEFDPIDDTPFEEPETTPEPTVDPGPTDQHLTPEGLPEGKSKRSWRSRGKVAKEAAPTRQTDGRRKVIILRIVIWTVLAVVALAGLRAIIAPPRTDVAGVLNAAEDKFGLSTFPVDAASGIASAFAKDYLTYSPSTATAREQRLIQYVTPSQKDASWTEYKGDQEQVVVQGPYLADAPVIDGPQRATFLVVAAVQDPKRVAAARANKEIVNPSWVYLSVPMFWAENGGVGVAGPPAFVPAFDGPNQSGGFQYADDDAAASAARPDLENFFTAWGASEATDLARYVPNAATAYTKAGLGGMVTFKSLSDISIQTSQDPLAERFAQVTVTWDYQGTDLRQGYRLNIYQNEEGRWFVTDIIGGDFQ